MTELLDKISQVGILILSPIALIFLTDKTSKKRKLGSIIGLFVQIFWYYSTYIASQWGMFIVVNFYTYAYIRGVINNGSKK